MSNYVICPHCGFKNMKPEKGVDEGSDGLSIMTRIHCSSCENWYMNVKNIDRFHYSVHMIFCNTCHRWKFVRDGKCETCRTPIVTEEKSRKEPDSNCNCNCCCCR